MPAAPRLSASVLLVRDGEPGLEVFLVRQSERSRAAPNASVFPGGTVRRDDYAATGEVSALVERAEEPPPSGQAEAVYACAVRELFEEAGVLLARGRGAVGPIDLDAASPAVRERLRAARFDLQGGALTLVDLLHEIDATPDFAALVPYSRWTTPAYHVRRYDTWFFVARMPPGQQAIHCDVETTAGDWETPAEALSAAARGERLVIFPTEQHLRRLARFGAVDDLLAHASAKPIPRVQPLAVTIDGETRPWLPEDLLANW